MEMASLILQPWGLEGVLLKRRKGAASSGAEKRFDAHLVDRDDEKGSCGEAARANSRPRIRTGTITWTAGGSLQQIIGACRK